MAYTRYIDKKFNAEHTRIIEAGNVICQDYAAQGLVLTLRQLFYQFVARGLIDNKQSEYNRLQSIFADARMAGKMDWDFLIDRTRNLLDLRQWDNPADMVKWASEQYHLDLWKPQKRHVEVWVEKDAAVGVIEGVCQANDVPYFSCRGYTSVSAMHDAAQRIRWAMEEGNEVVVLHIGDHDPSGLQMSEDIENRLRTFIDRDWLGLHMGGGQKTRGDIKAHQRRWMQEKGSHITETGAPWRLQRIALNMDQVEQYSPPPNPAKQTDSRYAWYQETTGLDESWELDALEPLVMQQLVVDHLDALRDEDLWGDTVRQLDEHRELLVKVSKNWNGIIKNLGESA